MIKYIAKEFFAGSPTNKPALEGVSHAEVKALIPAKTKPCYWRMFLVEGDTKTSIGGKISR